MPTEEQSSSASSQQQTDNVTVVFPDELTARIAGDEEHEHGQYSIEFYGADGSYVGHAEISPEFVQQTTQMVQSEVLNPSAALAVSQAQEANQVEMMASCSVAIVCVLFAIFGAVCVQTLLRSLSIK